MISVRAVLALAASASTAFAFQCGSSVSQEEVARAESKFSADRLSGSRVQQRAGPVQVYFHVVYEDETEAGGYVPDSQISGQIDRLNEDYIDTGLTFELAKTTRTQNAEWFNSVAPEGALQTEMKAELREGGAADLNLFSVGFNTGEAAGLLGYATFPWWYEDTPEDDGVVFLHSAIPGGAQQGYDQGRTVVHEVGHWVGLYHTFQGGCQGEGDGVADTPAEAEPQFECVARDSCPGQQGTDPIHNYMDYTQDACKNQFSAGQITRLQEAMSTYRGVTV